MTDRTAVYTLCNDPEVAKTTLNIPHPYTEQDARNYIQMVLNNNIPGTYQFAITRSADDTLIGSIGIHANQRHRHADIGYWIGSAYWNQSYATEALQRLIRFGFETMQLNRIYAGYFSDNIASRRVMEKAGMQYEGLFRQHYSRDGRYFDVGYCGIIRQDWLNSTTQSERT